MKIPSPKLVFNSPVPMHPHIFIQNSVVCYFHFSFSGSPFHLHTKFFECLLINISINLHIDANFRVIFPSGTQMPLNFVRKCLAKNISDHWLIVSVIGSFSRSYFITGKNPSSQFFHSSKLASQPLISKKDWTELSIIPEVQSLKPTRLKSASYWYYKHTTHAIRNK